MKVLLTADIHAGNLLPYAKLGPNGVSDRMVDCLSVLSQIGTIALEQECEQLWILGDVFEKRLLDAVTLKYVTQFFKSIAESIEIHLIPGNHEASDFSCRHYNVEFMQEIPNAWVHVQPEIWKIGQAEVALCPYLPLKEHINVLEGLDADVLFTHQMVVGAKQGHVSSSVGLPHKLLDKWEHCFLGHCHDNHCVTVDSSECSYLGSPWQLDFGEEIGKYCWVYDFDKTKLEPYSLKSPIFNTHMLNWGKNWTLEKLVKSFNKKKPYEYFRLIITDTQDCRAPIKEIAAIEYNGRFMRVEYRPEQSECKPVKSTGFSTAQNISSYIDLWVDNSDVDDSIRDTLKELGHSLCMK